VARSVGLVSPGVSRSAASPSDPLKRCARLVPPEWPSPKPPARVRGCAGARLRGCAAAPRRPPQDDMKHGNGKFVWADGPFAQTAPRTHALASRPHVTSACSNLPPHPRFQPEGKTRQAEPAWGGQGTRAERGPEGGTELIRLRPRPGARWPVAARRAPRQRHVPERAVREEGGRAQSCSEARLTPVWGQRGVRRSGAFATLAWHSVAWRSFVGVRRRRAVRIQRSSRSFVADHLKARALKSVILLRKCR
jgi:hypothetical protein